MTPPAEFESYSRNGEDVVLWRTLNGVERGRYMEVGAHDPRVGSVSAAFYDRGWTGITVEPDPEFATLHREQRPRDVQIEAAATGRDGGTVTLHVVDGTGLSTLGEDQAAMRAGRGFRVHDIAVPARSIDGILEEVGCSGQETHFVSICTEGSETEVLAGMDLAAWRPWVLVIDVTGPASGPSRRQDVEEMLRPAGYRLCLFDGLCCFFVAEEQYERLGPRLSFPACVLDNFTTPAYRRWRTRAETVPALLNEVSRWRSQALSWWAEAMNHAEDEDWKQRFKELSEAYEGIVTELETVYQSRSWRLTAPLRSALAVRSRTQSAS